MSPLRRPHPGKSASPPRESSPGLTDRSRLQPTLTCPGGTSPTRAFIPVWEADGRLPIQDGNNHQSRGRRGVGMHRSLCDVTLQGIDLDRALAGGGCIVSRQLRCPPGFRGHGGPIAMRPYQRVPMASASLEEAGRGPSAPYDVRLGSLAFGFPFLVFRFPKCFLLDCSTPRLPASKC
jgi:hypothetical protein